jgi:hypothetical protein
MKLASIVEIAMLIIYHQGTEKILTERWNVFFVICMLFVCNLPQKWNSFPSESSTTKSKDIGGIGMGDDHWKCGKNIFDPWCESGVLLWWVGGVHPKNGHFSRGQIWSPKLASIETWVYFLVGP